MFSVLAVFDKQMCFFNQRSDTGSGFQEESYVKLVIWYCYLDVFV